MFSDAGQHAHWLSIANRYARNGTEPADVLQEASLAAFKAGRADLQSASGQRYFRGIIRKTAWRMMRAQARRHRNELAAQVVDFALTSDRAQPASQRAPAPDLSSLPPSLQAVANLVMANLDRDEIRSALSISDDALRRRIADLRRYLESDPLARDQILAVMQTRAAPEDVGLIRQALVLWLKRRSDHAMGTVDPDGHLIAVALRPFLGQRLPVAEKSLDSLTNPPRPATDQ